VETFITLLLKTNIGLSSNRAFVLVVASCHNHNLILYSTQMKRHLLISIHIFSWLTIPFLITFIIWSYQYTNFIPGLEDRAVEYFDLFKKNILISLITIVIGAFGFYITFYYIVPIIFQNNRGKSTALVLFIFLTTPLFIILILSQVFFAIHWFLQLFVILSYIILIPFSILGALLRVYQKWEEESQEKMVIEKQNIERQLELIKAKIDPHFLFNTINNIDILVEDEPEKASKYIKKLSKILRFTLYHANENKISLSNELNYLREFIELQKIRSINSDFVQFRITGDPEKLMIAPMVLTSFVENAFKYVANKDFANSIVIQVSISKQNLEFRCQNTFIANQAKISKTSGIGISSIKERLKLIYKNNYNLKIHVEGEYFIVQLQINLND